MCPCRHTPSKTAEQIGRTSGRLKTFPHHESPASRHRDSTLSVSLQKVMKIPRRLFLQFSPLLFLRAPSLRAADARVAPIFLGQGTMAGEVTASTALLQTRLTVSTELDADGDLPGAAGVACFEWSTRADFSDARRTRFQAAAEKRDFIVRAELTGLDPKPKPDAGQRAVTL